VPIPLNSYCSRLCEKTSNFVFSVKYRTALKIRYEEVNEPVSGKDKTLGQGVLHMFSFAIISPKLQR